MVPTFEMAFNLDADVICLFLSKDCGVQGSAIPPLSHRAPSAGGRYRFCGSESENDRTVGHRRRRRRLNVVDFQAFQALQASKVELVVKRQDAIELWVVGAVWIWQSSV